MHARRSDRSCGRQLTPHSRRTGTQTAGIATGWAHELHSSHKPPVSGETHRNKINLLLKYDHMSSGAVKFGLRYMTE